MKNHSAPAISIRGHFTVISVASPVADRTVIYSGRASLVIDAQSYGRFSMPSLTEWKVPPAYQPRAGDYSFDLDRVLSSVVGLHSIIPADAFSADTLGTERAGNGVVIDDGLVLTIGYLITEAETVWLHLGDGRVVEGHALGFDSVSGFGLVQALGPIDLDPLPLGSSADAKIGDRVVMGGAGGRTRSGGSPLAGQPEYAGYWGDLLHDA